MLKYKFALGVVVAYIHTYDFGSNDYFQIEFRRKQTYSLLCSICGNKSSNIFKTFYLYR